MNKKENELNRLEKFEHASVLRSSLGAEEEYTFNAKTEKLID